MQLQWAAPMPPDMIYLNAASHGLPGDKVRARVLKHVKREAQVGPVAAAREAADEIAAARQKAADLIGAAPGEVAFAQTTMAGWIVAVSALPLKGSRILVAPDEWGEIVQAFKRFGHTRNLRLEVMPTTPEGDLDIAALEASMDGDIAAISVPMVSSLRGRRYPVEDIGSLARPDHCFYLVDGAQALGQMPVDVGRIGCDIFAATARKWLRAPRGTAVLFASASALERMASGPVPDPRGETARAGQPDATRFEAYDHFPALRLGLGAAIDVLDAHGIAFVSETVRAHARHVRDRIARAGFALASPAKPQSGITSFLVPAGAAGKIRKRLEARGIAVKFPPPPDEPMREPPDEGQVLVRVSPHIYNEAGDVDVLFDEIASLI